ncbi:uncharacterized protein LOC110707126 [Chenopodium quinoa]|uniref:uncharacterized protein LOC110707126 n=1 Tax=Chenopodium quinoa TaxID=63459 RepID=UPI000B782F34|nr:uncharacterized protein LOC110707126 [Chenopodium quinoa]
MLSLWHSKLHLMDGFEEFCPDIIDIKHTDSRSGFIVDPSADSLALALSNLLDSRSIKIDGLGLEYIVSEQGLAVEFTDDEAKKLETEFKITRDSMNRVVAIQIQHIGHHIPSMKD